MTQPPAGGTPDWQAAAPSWPAPSWGPPAWTEAAWSPPAGTPVVPPSSGRGRTVTLALVGVGSAVLGAVGAAFLVSAVFLSSAEDIGREMAQGIGDEIGTSIGDSMMSSVEESMSGVWSSTDPYASGGPLVEESDPVPPVPGPDPVLDSYAQNCFDGDMQACDDLYYESPPLSGYEQYASTCGGRVKSYTVPYCTDLGD